MLTIFRTFCPVQSPSPRPRLLSRIEMSSAARGSSRPVSLPQREIALVEIHISGKMDPKSIPNVPQHAACAFQRHIDAGKVLRGKTAFRVQGVKNNQMQLYTRNVIGAFYGVSLNNGNGISRLCGKTGYFRPPDLACIRPRARSPATTRS